MIETEQSVTVDAPIDRVWDHVQDMQRWASIMPGYQQFDVIDANDSEWTLKVGVGALVRTVRVLVHVEEWAGPECVTFAFKLRGDPVEGCGTYVAAPNGGGTDIRLAVQVKGGGPMAPMWEAMGKPLLPKLAKGFAEQLKVEIEKGAAERQAVDEVLLPAEGRLRRLWRAIFGRNSGG